MGSGQSHFLLSLSFLFYLAVSSEPCARQRCGLEEVPDGGTLLWCPGDGHIGRDRVKHLVGEGSGPLSCSVAAWGEGEQCGGGLDGPSQSMLLLIPRSFEARDVSHVLQAKPNPCVNGLRAASHGPRCIAPCLGQLPLGFPNGSAPFLAFTDVSSSDKLCHK